MTLRDFSMDEDCRPWRRVLFRERRRRQPPEVSGPLAPPTRRPVFEEAAKGSKTSSCSPWPSTRVETTGRL
jgi:hypothetical protein